MNPEKVTALKFLQRISNFCGGFHSRERSPAKASRSELERWLRQKAVIINGVTPGPTDEVHFPVKELVLFPSGKNKTTIYYEP